MIVDALAAMKVSRMLATTAIKCKDGNWRFAAQLRVDWKALSRQMARSKKTVTKTGSAEPHWKTVEKVVALLEKSLAPEATVRHNVKLPCLTTGHQEQCDVVIELGAEPRVMRTIVEVQKRNQRVKPNDFRGWCQKMRDIGANRLICVSAMPFPRSIKEKVLKELGPSVLLVRLEALQAKQWPFQIVNNAMKVYKSKVTLDGAIIPNPLLMFTRDQHPFQEYMGKYPSSEQFSKVIRREEREELLPIIDLVNEGVQQMNARPDLIHLPEGTHRVPLRWNPKGVSLCLDGKTAPIMEVQTVFIVEVRSIMFPFEISSYTQEGHNPLAWVARACGTVDGKDGEIRFVCKPTVDGGFCISEPQLFGIDEGAFIFWGTTPIVASQSCYVSGSSSANGSV